MGWFAGRPFEAFQFTGPALPRDAPEWAHDAMLTGKLQVGRDQVLIDGAEGVKRAKVGDWIIRSRDGEFTPCPDEVFREAFDETGATAIERPLRIEFRQHDWIPGFAAFHEGATTPEGTAFCVLNVGSILATVAAGAVPPKDVPFFIVESMLHEITHAIEQWAGVEFDEERVEALSANYRAQAEQERGADHVEG